MNTLQNITDMFLQKAGNHQLSTDTAGQMKKYEMAYRSGEYIMMSFSKADSVTGDLSFIDDDITVIMPADQINGKPYDLRFRAQKLDDIYCVRVMSIDNSNRIVYVSHQEARIEKRPEIESVIETNLKQKMVTTAKGKVLKIQSKTVNGEQVDTGVWLDLCGVGIPGYVYIGNWKKTFTENLRGKVFYGDVVEVLVQEKVERKNGIYYYACSRKELVQDPWDDQDLNEKYHKGDIVRIKCLSRRENHWFGQINGLEDIQVFAEYPSQKHNFAIVPGMEYMGTIYYINTKEHSLKARVFQALSFEQLAEEDAAVDKSMEDVEKEEILKESVESDLVENIDVSKEQIGIEED